MSVLCSEFFPPKRYLGPRMPVELIADNKDLLQEWIPPGAFIRAPQGIQFRVTYFLGRSSASEYPEQTEYVSYFDVREVSKPKPQCPRAGDLSQGVPEGTGCVALSERWLVVRVLAPN